MAGYRFVPLPNGKLGYGPISMSNEEVLAQYGIKPTAPDTGRHPFLSGLEAAKSGITTGLPYAIRKADNSLSSEQEADYQRRLQESAAKQEELLPGGPKQFGGGNGFVKPFVENALVSAPQMLAQGAVAAGGAALGSLAGPEGTIAGAAEGAELAGAGQAAQIAARAAMAKRVGGALGMVAGGSPFYVGSNVERATSGGQTALTSDQAVRSLGIAPVQAAGDILEAEYLPFGKALGAEGFKGNLLTRMGKGALMGSASEAITEPLQQVGERYAAGLDLGSPEAMNEYGQAAVTAGILGAGFGGVGGVTNKYKPHEAPPAAETGAPADMLDLQGGTFNEKQGPEVRKSVNLEDRVRQHLDLTPEDNVDETVASVEGQRRAIATAMNDAQTQGDIDTFYKLQDSLMQHNEKYFESSDPEVQAKRQELLDGIDTAQAAVAKAKKPAKAQAKLEEAVTALRRFDRTENISPVQEYINARRKEEAKSADTQRDLLGGVGRLPQASLNNQVAEGSQYDLFGAAPAAPNLETNAAPTSKKEVATDTPLFDRRPLATVALDFSQRNVLRNLRGSTSLQGAVKGYATSLSAKMVPLFQKQDLPGLQALLEKEETSKGQLATIDQYLPIINRALDMVSDFEGRVETAKRQEINIRAHEGQANAAPGTVASGAPTMQDAVSIARERDRNAQAAAGEQAQAQQAAANEQAVVQKAQAEQAQAAQTAESSKRNQVLTAVLRNPDTTNYYNTYEKQLKDLGMDPTISEEELAQINRAKEMAERRSAGREVFKATEADQLVEELRNSIAQAEASTPPASAERLIAKRDATVAAITKALDFEGNAETDALEAIEKLVGKNSYSQAQSAWQKMMAAKEEALNATSEPEAKIETPQPENTNATQEGEQSQVSEPERQGTDEVGPTTETSGSDSTVSSAEEVEKPTRKRGRPAGATSAIKTPATEEAAPTRKRGRPAGTTKPKENPKRPEGIPKDTKAEAPAPAPAKRRGRPTGIPKDTKAEATPAAPARPRGRPPKPVVEKVLTPEEKKTATQKAVDEAKEMDDALNYAKMMAIFEKVRDEKGSEALSAQQVNAIGIFMENNPLAKPENVQSMVDEFKAKNKPPKPAVTTAPAATAQTAEQRKVIAQKFLTSREANKAKMAGLAPKPAEPEASIAQETVTEVLNDDAGLDADLQTWRDENDDEDLFDGLDEHPFMVAYDEKYDEVTASIDDTENTTEVKALAKSLRSQGVIDDEDIDTLNDAVSEADREDKFDTAQETLSDIVDTQRENHRGVITEAIIETETIHSQLTEPDKKVIAAVYGEPSYNEEAKKQFVQDVLHTIAETGRKVSKQIDKIIRRIQGAVISAAIIFNPMALHSVGIKVPTAISSTIKSDTGTTEVPKAAAAKMSAEAKYVYEVSAATAMKLNKGFFIADKPNGVIHVFNKSGEMIASGPALFGMTKGDTALTGVDPFKNDAAKITPAGTFHLVTTKASDYTGGYVLKLKETETSSAFVAIHAVYTQKAEQQRETRLETTTIADNKISTGCINTSADMFLNNILPNAGEFEGGLAFVLPDKVENTKTVFKAPAGPKPAEQFSREIKGELRSVSKEENERQIAKREEAKSKFRAELDRIGLRKIGIEVLTTLEGQSKYGVDKEGTYTPSKKLVTIVLNPEGGDNYTLGHEAVHALEDLGLLTANEKGAILEWAKSQKDIKAFITENYSDRTLDEQDSEYVAEAYARWLHREQKFPGRVNLFFRKLTGFFDALKNVFKGYGFTSPDAVLEAIDGGYFNGRKEGKSTLGYSTEPLSRATATAYQNANNQAKELLSGYANQGATLTVISNKLIDMAVNAGIPSARKLERLVAEQGSVIARLDRVYENLSDRFDALKSAVERGVGKGTINGFIQNMRFHKDENNNPTFHWGFDPNYTNEDGSKVKVVIDPELEKQFKALSSEGQQIVRDVFKQNRDNLLASKKAVLEAQASEYDALIKDANDRGDTKEASKYERAKVRDMALYNTRMKIDPNKPYAPVKRFGDFVVAGRSKEYLAMEQKAQKENTPEAWEALQDMERDPDHYFVDYAQNRLDAIRMRDQIAQNYPHTDYFHKDDTNLNGGVSMYSAFQRMQKLIQEQGDTMDPTIRRRLNALATKLYIQTLSAHSSRKSEMTARLVHSGDLDMVRGSIAHGRADARFIGSLKKNSEISDTLRDMEKESKGNRTNSDKARTIMQEIKARHAANLAPVNQNALVDKVLALTTAQYLVTSPMFLVQQGVQNFVITLPTMAAKHGYSRAASALGEGYNAVKQAWGEANVSKPLDIEKLTGKTKLLARFLADRNALDVGIDKDMGNWKSGSNGAVSNAMQSVMKTFGGITRKLEAINRLSSGVAMFTLENEKATASNVDPEAYASYVKDAKETHPGEEYLTEKEFVSANEALRTIMDTHGDYSMASAPRWMKGPIGRLTTQFRKFQIMQLSLYTQAINDGFFNNSIPAAQKEIARKTLLYMTGHAALFAGALGLPGAGAGEWLWEAINKLMGREGPFTAESDLRKAIGNNQLANLLLNGAPTLAGIDLSGSLGQGNLLSIAPYTEVPKDKATYQDFVLKMMGPAVGGVGVDFYTGAGFMSQGQYMKGLEKMMPKGVANIIKSYRESTEGVTDKSGATTMSPDKIDTGASVATALGIRTTDVSDRQFRQGQAIEITKYFEEQTSTLKRNYIAAASKKDGAKMQELRQKWIKVQAQRAEAGLARQPLSQLIKAPRELAKREKNVIGGVAFTKSTRRMAQMLNDENSDNEEE